MALDTANKRRSAARRYHVPDGAIDSGSERLAAARRYSGISITAIPVDHIRMVLAVSAGNPTITVSARGMTLVVSADNPTLTVDTETVTP